MPWPLGPRLQMQLKAVALILQKDFPHLQSGFLTVDKGIHLKIVFKAAEIHVRRANCRQLVVRDHQFGMEKTLPIQINLHSGCQHRSQIGAGSQMGNPRISLQG